MTNGGSAKGEVAVIGGGIAGLSAAVFLAEKGYRIRLYEASPKLGGRAYSFFDKDKGRFFDNGQHLLAGWYKDTIRYLKIIGSYDMLEFQERLRIDYLEKGQGMLSLSSTGLKPPANLLTGLLRFKGFDLKEKMKLFNLRKIMKNEAGTDGITAEDLLEAHGQSGNLRKYFWDPFILAVFNTEPRNVAASLLTDLLSGSMADSRGFTLVLPGKDLNKVFIEPAEHFLLDRNCEIHKSTRITGYDMDERMNYLTTDDTKMIFAEYYISALPFFGFSDVFGNRFGSGSEKLRTSSIVSVHLFLKHRIAGLPGDDLGMAGLIGTRTQWLFRKSDDHLSLVISGSDALGVTKMKNEEIAAMCISELASCLKGFEADNVSDFRVIKEKRATFIPDTESIKHRPSQRTEADNFFIAGDWTDTGLPSTIEGAVRSASVCAMMIDENSK
ncbi:MAG: hydroxysqualene dehydroxylase HpnE [Ignavibacteria bacterium]|nr:hydroxysqualene dehydroxylase HpnE [Ignavibacteria bacterium]